MKIPGPASVLLALFVAASAPAQEDRKSKNPPPGAPWVRSFPEARKAALAAGKPIFLYSTKTY